MNQNGSRGGVMGWRELEVERRTRGELGLV